MQGIVQSVGTRAPKSFLKMTHVHTDIEAGVELVSNFMEIRMNIGC